MSVCSTLNWKLDMFVFQEMGKLEYLEKKPFEAWGENQLTNSNHIHIWCQHWVLNPEYFGRRAGLKNNPVW